MTALQVRLWHLVVRYIQLVAGTHLGRGLRPTDEQWMQLMADAARAEGGLKAMEEGR